MARQETGGIKSGEVTAALGRAAGGSPAELYRQLELQSGLPGPRMNTRLAVAFAQDAARLGAKVDPLLWEMASLPANEARGASGKEFVCVCGVLAIGVRAAEDPALRPRALELLESRCDDLRFHVREAVPDALATLGAKMPDLCDHVRPWMENYFHAAAVILALRDPQWLETFGKGEHEAPLELLDAAYQLASDAPRAAFRYPGHKALIEALTRVPKELARRFGLPVFELIEAWAPKSRPELRDPILANLDDPGMKKPFADEIDRIKKALDVAKGPPRDPSRIVQGMRGRGKKRNA